MRALRSATQKLKSYIQETEGIAKLIVHPTEQDLGYLYGVIVVDDGHDESRRTVETETRDSLKDSKLDELSGDGEAIVG